MKITGDDTVKLVYEKSGTLGLTLTGEYQYTIKLSCVCSVIKRFACFSSTLNCLIVKKGSDTCGSDDSFVDWLNRKEMIIYCEIYCEY